MFTLDKCIERDRKIRDCWRFGGWGWGWRMRANRYGVKKSVLKFGGGDGCPAW